MYLKTFHLENYKHLKLEISQVTQIGKQFTEIWFETSILMLDKRGYLLSNRHFICDSNNSSSDKCIKYNKRLNRYDDEIILIDLIKIPRRCHYIRFVLGIKSPHESNGLYESKEEITIGIKMQDLYSKEIIFKHFLRLSHEINDIHEFAEIYDQNGKMVFELLDKKFKSLFTN